MSGNAAQKHSLFWAYVPAHAVWALLSLHLGEIPAHQIWGSHTATTAQRDHSSRQTDSFPQPSTDGLWHSP